MSHPTTLPGSRTRPVARAGTGERGAITIQIVILMPLMFLLMFAGMQGALIYHGRTVAIAAAQEAARATAAQHGTTDHGRAAASALIEQAGGTGTLNGVTISVTRGPINATARVTATTLSVIPGWSPRISQTSTAPVERLTR